MERHRPEFGTKDEKEYQKRAIEFVAKSCGGNIVGYACSDGKIVRFDKKTCEYGTGYPGKHICTYMIPKIQKRDLYIDPAKAYDYFYAEAKVKGSE